MAVETAETIRRDRIWNKLYRQLFRFLGRYGKDNFIGEGDFWIVDDNYGWTRHTVYLFNFTLLSVPIIKAVQRMLDDHPDWEIVFAFDFPGHEEDWPRMGVTIRRHEIIDGLRREYLPERYKSFAIPGSRPGTGDD